jgi:magnesium-transporting ATPase (P-type)
VPSLPLSSPARGQLTRNKAFTALLLVKGAPERVLQCCVRMTVEGRDVALGERERALVLEGCERLGAKGERVLAFAELVSLHTTPIKSNITYQSPESFLRQVTCF